jgi:pimeloyl-ACP methyl ester carboxylesterase
VAEYGGIVYVMNAGGDGNVAGFRNSGGVLTPLADGVRCPVLLAWGTRDPILPWRIDGRRARAALTDAEIVTFAGAGHQPFLERPDEFLDRTASFLSRLRTANTA